MQGTVFVVNGIAATNAQVSAQNFKTETDAAGHFTLPNVKESVLHLTVFLPGYKKMTVPYSVV